VIPTPVSDIQPTTYFAFVPKKPIQLTLIDTSQAGDLPALEARLVLNQIADLGSCLFR
jgi:hypothetical protein